MNSASDRSAGLACAVLALAMLLNLAVGRLWFSGEAEPRLVYLVLMEAVSFLFPAWLYFWRTPGDRSVLARRAAPGKLLLSFACGAALDVAVSVPTALAESWIPGPEELQEARLFMAELFLVRAPLGWGSVLLSGAVFVGFCEEALFRGAVLSSFARRMKPSRANVLVAAMFALIHMDPWTLPGIFLLGLFFGKARLRYQTVWIAAAAHAGANTAGIALLNWDPDMGDWGLPLFVAGILAFFPLFAFLFKGDRRTGPRKSPAVPAAPVDPEAVQPQDGMDIATD